MRKAEEKALGQLIGFAIILVIILYPFEWVYQNTGGVGLTAVIVIPVVLFIWLRWHKRSKQQAAFDTIALMVLRNELTLDEISRLRESLVRADFSRADLIGNLKILRESLYLCLNSKKRDVAESRMETVDEIYNRIRRDHVKLVSSSVLGEIEQAVESAREQFKTRLYLNVARGHTEKAHTLKRASSKLKYLDLAKEVLNEGLGVAGSDPGGLRQALTEVEREQADLEGGMT